MTSIFSTYSRCEEYSQRQNAPIGRAQGNLSASLVGNRAAKVVSLPSIVRMSMMSEVGTSKIRTTLERLPGKPSGFCCPPPQMSYLDHMGDAIGDSTQTIFMVVKISEISRLSCLEDDLRTFSDRAERQQVLHLGTQAHPSCWNTRNAVFCKYIAVDKTILLR